MDLQSDEQHLADERRAAARARQLANLRPGQGRPKGVKNKIKRTALENLEQAFEKTGGWRAMVKWVEESPENRGKFYLGLYAKLLPLQVKASVTHTAAPQLDVRSLTPEQRETLRDLMLAALAQSSLPPPQEGEYADVAESFDGEDDTE